MRKRLYLFFKRPFVKNVTVVATGTAAAQIVSMVFSPLITRLYGAEAFGMLGVFTTMLSFLTPIAAFSYPIAIVLPKTNEKAIALTRLSLYTSFVFSLLIALSIIFFKNFLIDVLNLHKIGDLIYLLPIAIFFTVVVRILQQWAIRLKLFKFISKIGVIQATIINLIKSGLGVLNPAAGILIGAAAFGSLVHSALFWTGVKKRLVDIKATLTSTISKTTAAQEYRDFAYFRTPQIFLNSISSGLPIILLTTFFGPAAAGFYTLCRSVLLMPSKLLGNSVADVFYPRIAEASNNNENLFKLILKATKALAGVGALPFLIVISFGPWLFGFVFGKEWVVAGEYARWIALWQYVILLNKPSVVAIPVLKLQGHFLIYEIISVVLRALSLSIGFLVFKSDIQAIILFSMTGVFLNVILITLVLRKSRWNYKL